MGRKNVLEPFHTLNNGDMSGDLTSAETNVLNLDNVYYQLEWSGNPVGTFIFECMIGTIWSAMDPRDADGNPPAAAGSAGSHIVNLIECPGRLVRMRYDSTSGAGTLNVYVMAKQTGG